MGTKWRSGASTTPAPPGGDGVSKVSRSSWEAICAELFKARHEAFSAGINTSVYVNAYMTMHEHDIGGVLEEMRCGQARLESQRAAEEARLVAVGKEVATRSPPCRYGYKSKLLEFSLSGECSIDAFPRSRLREASIVAAVGRATVTGRAIDVLRSMRAGERRVAGAWAHIGMRVRCTPKYEASLGLEQETSIVYVAVRCFLSLSSLLSHLSHLVPPPPTLLPPPS